MIKGNNKSNIKLSLYGLSNIKKFILLNGFIFLIFSVYKTITTTITKQQYFQQQLYSEHKVEEYNQLQGSTINRNRVLLEEYQRVSKSFLVRVNETISDITDNKNNNYNNNYYLDYQKEYNIKPTTSTTTNKYARMKRKDLIMGMASNIGDTHLAIFVKSLREHCTINTTDVLIFLDSKSMESFIAKTIIQDYHIQVIEFEPEKLSPIEMRNYHPSTYRWPMQYEFLRTHHQLYNRVLMIDARDSVFQRNPFDIIMGQEIPGFYAFSGVLSIPIGKFGWNGGWIKDCFGNETYHQLYNNDIICSGVSMGTVYEVLDYLNKMTNKILSDDFHKCERNGVDQGIHNVLVHTNQIINLKMQRQGIGLVTNMQAGKYIKDSNNLIKTQQDALSAIVHQYDRDKLLEKYYTKIYTASTSQSCNGFLTFDGADIFKGHCDLRTESGTNKEDCCNQCDMDLECNGWTFDMNFEICYLKSCSTESETRIEGSHLAYGYKQEQSTTKL